MQQLSFDLGKSKYRYCHGGELRKKRAGRGLRQLSTKEPLHLVFKADRAKLRLGYRAPRCFPIVNRIIKAYARKFFVKIERFSIQNDHLHLLIRTTKRSQYQHFFRVVAGQIAQTFEREGLLKGGVTDTSTRRAQQKSRVTDTPNPIPAELANQTHGTCKKSGTRLWKQRPFTRIVRGYKAIVTAVAYIELNEQEALGNIPHRSTRLRGLSGREWELLWK